VCRVSQLVQAQICRFAVVQEWYSATVVQWCSAGAVAVVQWWCRRGAVVQRCSGAAVEQGVEMLRRCADVELRTC